jgi:hypothetical protein
MDFMEPEYLILSKRIVIRNNAFEISKRATVLSVVRAKGFIYAR